MKGKAKKRPRTFTKNPKPEPSSQSKPAQEKNQKVEKSSHFTIFHRSQKKPAVVPVDHKKPEKDESSSEKSKDIDNKSKPYTIIAAILIALNVFAFGAIIYFVQQTSRIAILSQYHDDSFSASVPELSNVGLDISARAAIIFDTTSRTAVYQKDADFRFAPASTTKIMTAVVALEHYSLNDVVTVPESVNNVVGSKMNLVAGERISIRSLLYGMLLPSGNDAAYVLSTLDPNGTVGFVSKMNQKAAELKMDNTHFVDSSGYDDANYTSAFDLARLAAYALQNPTFRQVVQTRSITVTDVSGKIVHNLENLNKLLSNSDVFGIKTGFTNEAGEVLVTSYEWQGRTYIIIVMKSLDRFADTQVLINAIQSSVQLKKY